MYACWPLSAPLTVEVESFVAAAVQIDAFWYVCLWREALPSNTLHAPPGYLRASIACLPAGESLLQPAPVLHHAAHAA